LALSQATLNVDVRMIEVYASVAENGQPVSNLQVQDFVVLEDKRKQTIRVFQPQSAAISIALLVDTTGSMTSDLPRVKNAVSRLLSTVKPYDNVALFTFANGLNKLSDFSTDRNATLGAILKAPRGRTNGFIRLARAIGA
jgi:VWFA-related protein